jgi:hypothetical protein
MLMFLIYFPLHVSASRGPSSEGFVCQHVGNYHYNVMYIRAKVNIKGKSRAIRQTQKQVIKLRINNNKIFLDVLMN